MEQAFASVQRLITEGKFLAAFEMLTRSRQRLESIDPVLYLVLECESGLQIGADQLAADHARQWLSRDVPPEYAARLHRVMSAISFDRGDLGASVEHLNSARIQATRAHAWPQLAAIELSELGLASTFQSLESAMTRLPEMRRLIVRVGDPHLMVLLRLYVARVEARRGGLVEAQRHHAACAFLLDSYPNIWLHGVVQVDRAVISMLQGDLDASLEASQAAAQLAQESGHHHTKVAAAINLSHVYEWLGDSNAARRHIDYALTAAKDNRHMVRAALDSLANVLITAGKYTECHRILEETRRRASVDKDSRPHWDAITELYSRSRLAVAEERWSDANADLTEAIMLAEQYGDHVWRRRAYVARARSNALGGALEDAAIDLSQGTGQMSEPHSLAEYYESVATVSAAGSRHQRAGEAFGRALRIAAAMPNKALCEDIAKNVASLAKVSDTRVSAAPPALPSPDLDSAVAILELAGHPHILGREAFAVIAGAGCAEAVALVAAGAAGARVIDVRGWDERQAALAAARPAEGVEILPVGRHRDEAWQIVARPKTAVDPYCTFAAIRKLVATAVALDQYRRDEKQRAALWPPDALDADGDAIWASEQMAETLAIARRIAPTPLSVLLTGETGTGKEMLARAIHRASDRADRPFLPFNCTAVPRDMLDSQLFGYRKGAFTGADASFQGVIRSAAGGTLFLDEIGEIGPDVQPKLLRFLETREIHPLGEPQPVTVDVRVIAATNAGIEELVAGGRFREDLFYRLNVVRLKLPPLRERREEIPPLVHHYLRRYGDEQRKGALTLSDEALEYLLLYSWPGNVRQLANEVRRMVALAEPDATLTPALLSPEIQASRRTIAAAPAVEPEVRLSLDQPLPAAVQMLEQLMVRRALDRTHGRVEEASRLLGISRKGLFLKRRRWGLREAS